MIDTIDRREFVATLATALAARSLLSTTPVARHLTVGHTGITWGYAPENAESAIRDVGSLGYHAFESFGSVLEYWSSRGGLKRLLDNAKLPLRSAYCPFELTDPSKRRATVDAATRWGKLIHECGGTVAVVGPDAVTRSSYRFADHRAHIVSALNEIGHALADVGVVGALHPHTGSCVQTRDEVYAIMESVDTTVVKLAPDVGELQAGGSNPVQVVKDFLPVIRHAHLKDYGGGADHDGYCPLGQGKVDIRGVVDVLERSTQPLMLMVELNPSSSKAPVAPVETARISKAYLTSLGYSFLS